MIQNRAETTSRALKGKRTWILLALLYLTFFFWYTPWGGPVTEDEIKTFERTLTEAGWEAKGLNNWLEFLRTDTGNDFAMINVLDFRELAAPAPGLPPGISGSEAMSFYTEPFLSKALLSAAHPVFMGTAASPALDLWGIDDAHHWDQGALVRYRSRRDVMHQVMGLSEMAQNGDPIHAYKIAALEKTIAYPLDPWFNPADPRFVLALLALIIGLAKRRVSA